MHFRTGALVWMVLMVGSLNMVGYLLGIESIRKLGQVSAASPLPLVFSHFRGLETFSPRFAVIIGTPQGVIHHFPITPTTYGELQGPYNLRNVYGVAFAFGAVLKEPFERSLVNGVLHYALCPHGPLRAILERSPEAAKSLSAPGAKPGIRITPKNGAPVDLWVECAG